MQKVEISYKTIVFTVLFLLSLVVLYYVRHIILFLFICLIFSTALSPIVNKLEKLKIPRGLAILLLYILLVGGLAVAIASIVPVIIEQTTALLKNLPEVLDKIDFLNLGLQPSDYSDQLVKLPGNLLKIAASAFSNFIKLFTFLVINFYLLMERKKLDDHLHFLFAGNGKRAEKLILELEKRLGGWVRGELVLMVIVGLMSYVGLKLLDLDFVLPLALIAGLLELIPNIGPTISMIPAVIVGFASSPVIGLAVVALYILIQQVENNLIVPKVMQKAIGIHPLITIIGLMAGFSLGGIGGSLLAIPTILFIKVIVEQLYPFRRRSSH